MTEEVKKLTAEEELLKAASGGSTSEESSGDEDDGLSPEAKLINELKGKLEHSEETARNAIEERDAERRQKDDARSKFKNAAERNVETTETSIKNGLEAAKSRFESAQKDWDDAYDSGDKEKLRTASIKLNDAQAVLRGAEYQTEQFSNWKKSGGGVVDPNSSRFSPKEQEWIDKNPRFNTDRKFRAAVYAAHEEAVNKGIVIDSVEYFDNVEDYLKDVGLKGVVQKKDPVEEEVEAPKKEETKKSEKKASSTATPPGGASGSPPASSRKMTFTMTPEHREAASICYPEIHRKDPKKAEEMYAARQLEIQQKRARGEQV